MRSVSVQLRRAWVQIHLWLGLTLGVIGVAIGITGSMLVYENTLDAAVNPQRYAVTGVEIALSYAEYVDRASRALDGKARATVVRLPQESGMPVTVIARGSGESAGVVRVYLDPPTGRVLGTVPGGGFIGAVRQLHEYLLLREYNGRSVVGLVGIGMLISSLSGLYLWWPAGRRWREALGFRRGLTTTRNLHYFFGFYCALVLAMLSFTGIFLAYPDAMRSAVAAVAPVTVPVRSVNAADGGSGKRITPDEAVRVASESYPQVRIVAITLPMAARSVYRVSMNDLRDRAVQTGGNTVIFVDPYSGAVLRRLDASTRTSGDAFLALQRTLHSGLSLGVAGRALIFIVGLLPALFVVTGSLMWLRQRRARKAGARLREPAAESA